MQEEKLYEYVLIKEIEANNLNKGYWAKALAQVTWKEDEAKVVYIESRVAYLKDFFEKYNIDYKNREIDQLKQIIEAIQESKEKEYLAKDNVNTIDQPKNTDFTQDNKEFLKTNSISKDTKSVENVVKNSSLSEYYFNDDARVNQKEYFFRSFLPFVSICSMLFLLLYVNLESLKSYHIYGISIVAFIIMGIFILYPTIKRLNDMNLNSWFSIIIFIPVINLLFLFQLVLSPSFKAKNRYGDGSASYILNRYRYAGLFVESLIITSLLFVTLFHSVDLKDAVSTESKVDLKLKEEDHLAAYELEKEVEKNDTLLEATIDKRDNSLAIEAKTAISSELIDKKELAALDIEKNEQSQIKINSLEEKASVSITDTVLTKNSETKNLDLITPINSFSTEEEKRLTAIYLEESLDDNGILLNNINLEKKLPKKKAQVKSIKEKKEIKKIKKHQLYLITVPYRSKITFVNNNQKYKENMSLKAGKYKIKVEKKGYATQYKTINLNKNLVLEIFLKRSLKKQI